MLYVGLQDEDKIAVFAIDSDNGELTKRADIAALGGPSVTAISPDRNTLYVGHRAQPSHMTTLFVAFSVGVFTLISVEDTVCTFSAALAPGNCWSSGVLWRPPAGAISRRGGRSTTMSVAMWTDVADFLGRIAA